MVCGPDFTRKMLCLQTSVRWNGGKPEPREDTNKRCDGRGPDTQKQGAEYSESWRRWSPVTLGLKRDDIRGGRKYRVMSRIGDPKQSETIEANIPAGVAGRTGIVSGRSGCGGSMALAR